MITLDFLSPLEYDIIDMKIINAKEEDLKRILELQKICYKQQAVPHRITKNINDCPAPQYDFFTDNGVP